MSTPENKDTEGTAKKDNRFEIVMAILELVKSEIAFNKQLKDGIELMRHNKNFLKNPLVKEEIAALELAANASDKILGLYKELQQVLPSDLLKDFEATESFDKEKKILNEEMNQLKAKVKQEKNKTKQQALNKRIEVLKQKLNSVKAQDEASNERIKHLLNENVELGDLYSKIENPFNKINAALPEYFEKITDAVILHQTVSTDQPLSAKWRKHLPNIFSVTAVPFQRGPRIVMPLEALLKEMNKNPHKTTGILSTVQTVIETAKNQTLKINSKLIESPKIKQGAKQDKAEMPVETLKKDKVQLEKEIASTIKSTNELIKTINDHMHTQHRTFNERIESSKMTASLIQQCTTKIKELEAQKNQIKPLLDKIDKTTGNAQKKDKSTEHLEFLKLQSEAISKLQKEMAVQKDALTFKKKRDGDAVALGFVEPLQKAARDAEAFSAKLQQMGRAPEEQRKLVNAGQTYDKSLHDFLDRLQKDVLDKQSFLDPEQLSLIEKNRIAAKNAALRMSALLLAGQEVSVSPVSRDLQKEKTSPIVMSKKSKILSEEDIQHSLASQLEHFYKRHEAIFKNKNIDPQMKAKFEGKPSVEVLKSKITEWRKTLNAKIKEDPVLRKQYKSMLVNLGEIEKAIPKFKKAGIVHAAARPPDKPKKAS